ncbi:hypothetical protein CDAR_610251 [Caerostris darwini]|uniref:Uncharacterized protein n=1 Tax=Caerostris darwini TaxID=1538125 RepID=A0AAV4N9P8_9ARAC|nr:hypothetical protein CDAR_610251 [Caerostris darwini]
MHKLNKLSHLIGNHIRLNPYIRIFVLKRKELQLKRGPTTLVPKDGGRPVSNTTSIPPLPPLHLFPPKLIFSSPAYTNCDRKGERERITFLLQVKMKINKTFPPHIWAKFSLIRRHTFNRDRVVARS